MTRIGKVATSRMPHCPAREIWVVTTSNNDGRDGWGQLLRWNQVPSPGPGALAPSFTDPSILLQANLAVHNPRVRSKCTVSVSKFVFVVLALPCLPICSSTDPDFGSHMDCVIDLILLCFPVYVLWQSLVLVESRRLCVKPRKLPKISVTMSAMRVCPASASSCLRCAECKTRCNVVTGQPTGPMAHALWKLARRDRCWLNVIDSHLCSVPLAVNSP